MFPVPRGVVEVVQNYFFNMFYRLGIFLKERNQQCSR